MSLTITIRNDSDARQLIETLKGKGYPYTIEFTSEAEKKRTKAQNRSLHKWCSMLAEALNDAGYDVRATLKKDFEIPWTGILVKELMWKKVQEAMQGIHSTAEADRVQYSEVYEAINAHLGTTKGVSVPWPSRETMEHGRY